jgi:hypothetical protein
MHCNILFEVTSRTQRRPPSDSQTRTFGGLNHLERVKSLGFRATMYIYNDNLINNSLINKNSPTKNISKIAWAST